MSRFAVISAIAFFGGVALSNAANIKVQHRRAEAATVAVSEHRQRAQISMAAVMSGHAPAPAVAAAPAPAAAAVKDATHEMDSKPPKLPEQGYVGKDVRHENFKSMTKDW
eukprot:CAMPEP_0169103740 /NCGR_PEP_ID=MMETSP1015-20121227/22880_1 /TAXON_ID=342587 /ORGANISM="Karlodinium micrum, Strain CCMP2283" /LENGTH=109 /DNA_ID=CAMNT_0009164965 /DNA_START=57 /DNA_END=383 /DNA_ORIENTATION=+